MAQWFAHRLVPLSLLITGTNFVELFIRVNEDARSTLFTVANRFMRANRCPA
jgi:hypothetical protein